LLLGIASVHRMTDCSVHTPRIHCLPASSKDYVQARLPCCCAGFLASGHTLTCRCIICPCSMLWTTCQRQQHRSCTHASWPLRSSTAAGASQDPYVNSHLRAATQPGA
jgi:hypothetical protein